MLHITLQVPLISLMCFWLTNRANRYKNRIDRWLMNVFCDDSKTNSKRALFHIGVCAVTRVSTIVEILKIWSTIFSNKNSVNCILLHKFSLFSAILALFHNFFHIFTKKFKLSKNALVTLGVCALLCVYRTFRGVELNLPQIFFLPPNIFTCAPHYIDSSSLPLDIEDFS